MITKSHGIEYWSVKSFKKSVLYTQLQHFLKRSLETLDLYLKKKKIQISWVWWHMPLILSLGRQR